MDNPQRALLATAFGASERREASAAAGMALSLLIAAESALLLRARVVGPPLGCWAAQPRACPAPRAAVDLAPTPEVVELLVHRMVREGRLVKATMLLRGAAVSGEPPSAPTWTMLIAACRRAADYSTAAELLGEMAQARPTLTLTHPNPDPPTPPRAHHASRTTHHPPQAGLGANPNQYSSLIDALIKTGQPARSASLLPTP